MSKAKNKDVLGGYSFSATAAERGRDTGDPSLEENCI
jgi:hypothetical protein